jgi:alpha-tubulin suppressor-like RCC1 family protein
MTLASYHVIKVSCGGYHTLALTSDQLLFAFGSCRYGECGTDDTTDCLKPKRIELPPVNDLPELDALT